MLLLSLLRGNPPFSSPFGNTGVSIGTSFSNFVELLDCGVSTDT
jgi:hypothetical protein